jgi:hypothetical protein
MVEAIAHIQAFRMPLAAFRFSKFIVQKVLFGMKSNSFAAVLTKIEYMYKATFKIKNKARKKKKY